MIKHLQLRPRHGILSACVAHEQGVASRGLGIVVDGLDVEALGNSASVVSGDDTGVVAVAKDTLLLDSAVAVGEEGGNDARADFLGAGAFVVWG